MKGLLPNLQKPPLPAVENNSTFWIEDRNAPRKGSMIRIDCRFNTTDPKWKSEKTITVEEALAAWFKYVLLFVILQLSF